MVALDFQSIMSFIVLAGVICSMLLSVILVIGQIAKSSSAKYENPKYWARPWILVSYVLEYAAILALYHIMMFTDEVYMCLLQKLIIICSFALQFSMVLFGCHLLLTVYDPYILSGVGQLTVWISLLGLSWITGTITMLLLTGADGNNPTPNQSEYTELASEMTTSGFGTIDAPTYGDDMMDTSSWNMTLSILAPLSNMSYTSYTDIQYEYCYIVDLYYNIVVYRIPDLVLICCAGLIIPGLYKRLHRTVVRFFKRLHSPCSESQVVVTKWINQQRLQSVVFIQVELMFAIGRTLCFYKPEHDYCSYYVTVFDCHLLLFCVWCFLLKDVRNSVMITISWCKGCCGGTMDEDEAATDRVAMTSR